MTTITPHPMATATDPGGLDFRTLTSVELRKMTDTRSGRGLLIAIPTLVAGVLAWKLAHPEIEVSFDNYGGAVTAFVGFLTPLIGLLAMTSEWSQRTALTTFTLAPRRLPVLAAKYVSAVGLSLGVLAVGLLLSLAATGIGQLVHGHAAYDGLLVDVRSAAVFVVLQVTMAAAFGALAANTPVAVTAFLVAPTAWAAIAANLPPETARWFDVFGAYDQLSSAQPLEQIGPSLTALVIWVGAPAVAGLAVALRREVK